MAPNEKIKTFRDLRVWQAARILSVDVYKVSKLFPEDERFGLTSQIRRSAVSVPANIAEGFSRNGDKDKVHFYGIAMGSLSETLSHAYISSDLGFLSEKELKLIEDKVIDIQKMTIGLMKSAARRPA